MERFIPKKKKRMNQASKLAIRQAKLTGELPHMVMLGWLQTGVMELVETEEYTVGKGTKNEHTRTRVMKDKDGIPVKKLVALQKEDMLDIAGKCGRFFAPQLASTQVTGKDNGPLELTYTRQDAEEVIAFLSRPITLIEDKSDERTDNVIKLIPEKDSVN